MIDARVPMAPAQALALKALICTSFSDKSEGILIGERHLRVLARNGQWRICAVASQQIEAALPSVATGVGDRPDDW